MVTGYDEENVNGCLRVAQTEERQGARYGERYGEGHGNRK